MTQQGASMAWQSTEDRYYGELGRMYTVSIFRKRLPHDTPDTTHTDPPQRHLRMSARPLVTL